MANSYDQIATVSISIEQVIVDTASFDNILIVGPLPAVAPSTAPAKIAAYSSLEEVTDAGWVATGDSADPVGIAARIAFSQDPAPAKIYIAPIQTTTVTTYSITLGSTTFTATVDSDNKITALTSGSTVYTWNSTDSAYENGTTKLYNDGTTASGSSNALISTQYTTLTSGVTSSSSTTAEYAVTTVQRAISESGWYVLCPVGISDSELVTCAEYIETQERMMLYAETAFFGAGTDGANARKITTDYLRTGGIYARTSSDQSDDYLPTANNYIHVAFAVAWLANESGSETAAFKVLSGVNPASLTTAESTALANACLSYFTTVGSKNITMIGKVLGDEWLDIIRFRDWLKNDMQVRVCNVFVQRSKVPFTDDGIALIQNAMEASLKAGQEAGGIADDEYDEEGNENRGYVTEVPLASELDDSEKASRQLTGCKFTARLTGAIHFAALTGTLAYSL